MKNTALFTTLVLLAVACEKKDKKAELEQLKKEQKEISKQIATLEKELGLDTLSKKAKSVMVLPVRSGNFAHYIEIQGQVEAENNVNIGAQTPGVVTRIYVREGDYVGQGQVLAEVDGSLIAKSIQQLQTNLSLATTLYEKQKALWDQKVGTEIAYLQAKTNKESLEQQLAQLREQLYKTKIVSSIAGTVDEVYLKVGENAAPGAPGIRVVNTAQMRAVADVAEAHANVVKQGSDVIIYFPDLKKDIKSKVVFTSRVINDLSRSFRVEVALPNDKEIRPNMVTVLKIEDYKQESALTVPINVLQNSAEGSFIMVAAEENGKKIARRRKVEVGQIYNRRAEITSGLQPSDKIITVGYQDLNDGDPINYKL